MAYKRLGDILVSVGAISEEQLQGALATGREQHKRLGQVLIDEKIITERQLIDVLKIQLGVDFIDLTKVTISPQLAQLVPKNLAKRYTGVPVKLVGDQLYLAMTDPLNFIAIEEIRNATKKRVVPMIATASATDRAIVTLYGNEGMSRAIDELEKSITDTAGFGSDTPGEKLDEDSADAAPAIRFVNSILERAISENASDIHLEPREEEMTIRMRIDGVLHEIMNVPGNLKNAIVSRIKIMGDLDIAERRIPQDGRANVRMKDRDIDLRISTLPTIYGEKIVIRLLYKSSALLSPEGIGLKDDNLQKYNTLIQNANGVILIVGPTGSGKSSTMYTMVRNLASEEVNIVTLEDPVEYNLDGINQVQINEKVGMTFASGLRAILRQDPDIIAVGEIRDGETGEIAMRSAITGHLVLSTIHTNDAVSAVDRLIDIGIEPYMVSTALKGVISQRLVRRICPHCKKAYTPTEEEKLSIHLDPSDEVEFYKGTGCPECLNTGYRGRTAVFEILTMTSEIKHAVRTEAGPDALNRAVEASGFVPMIRDCQKLVLNGTTTVSEATRIMNTTD